jgi:hypothetical protein
MEEPGATDPQLLGHLLSPGSHVRGCFVIDLLLGRLDQRRGFLPLSCEERPISARQTWVLAGAVVLAALTLGTFLGPRSAAQKAEPPAAGPATPGRYRAISGNAKDGFFVVIDTQTGHCWSSSAGNSADISWIGLGSLAEKK